MTIAEKRFSRFLNYINRYHDLYITESYNELENYNAYKDIPKPVIQYALAKFINLKSKPRSCVYYYKDSSRLVYFFSRKVFILKSDTRRIYLRVLQANYRD